MWTETLEYLKDPYLVARIQKFFGVEILDEREKRKKKDDDLQKIHNDDKQSTEDSSSSGNETHKHAKPKFRIRNYFWYYLFLFGTQLGDELFYATFISFWFWNIDGAVGRRVIFVWATVMTIGQAMKDVICWPRPACPPVVRLQDKWSLEYGMPSTHAVIGVTIPFSVVWFTMNRYIYSVPTGYTLATFWSTLVCMSRLYLGMHTVLDVVVGIALAVLFMIPLIPLVDMMDHYFLTQNWAIIFLIALSILVVKIYPRGRKWTPTRGDTTMVVAAAVGVHVGAWINYKTGALSTPLNSPPYQIIWPSYPMIGSFVLRTIIGLCFIMGTKAVFKTLSYATVCAILKINAKELMNSENHLENKNKVLVDLIYKYIASFIIGINIVYVLPSVFTIIGIERPMIYTEI